MQELINKVFGLIETPKWPGMFIFCVCVFSLGFALVSQYGFGLQPCILCIYQRWPFVVAGILGFLAYWVSDRSFNGANILIMMCGAAFMVNTGIAMFHVGVEQEWWKGTEACHLPDLSNIDSPEAFMEMLENAPLTPCTQPQWDFMGLTMAALNVFLCFGMMVLSAFFSIFAVRKRNGF